MAQIEGKWVADGAVGPTKLDTSATFVMAAGKFTDSLKVGSGTKVTKLADSDPDLSSNSDQVVPSQKAIKKFVNNTVSTKVNDQRFWSRTGNILSTRYPDDNVEIDGAFYVNDINCWGDFTSTNVNCNNAGIENLNANSIACSGSATVGSLEVDSSIVGSDMTLAGYLLARGAVRSLNQSVTAGWDMTAGRDMSCGRNLFCGHDIICEGDIHCDGDMTTSRLRVQSSDNTSVVRLSGPDNFIEYSDQAYLRRYGSDDGRMTVLNQGNLNLYANNRDGLNSDLNLNATGDIYLNNPDSSDIIINKFESDVDEVRMLTVRSDGVIDTGYAKQATFNKLYLNNLTDTPSLTFTSGKTDVSFPEIILEDGGTNGTYIKKYYIDESDLGKRLVIWNNGDIKIANNPTQDILLSKYEGAFGADETKILTISNTLGIVGFTDMGSDVGPAGPKGATGIAGPVTGIVGPQGVTGLTGSIENLRGGYGGDATLNSAGVLKNSTGNDIRTDLYDTFYLVSAGGFLNIKYIPTPSSLKTGDIVRIICDRFSGSNDFKLYYVNSVIAGHNIKIQLTDSAGARYIREISSYASSSTAYAGCVLTFMLVKRNANDIHWVCI